MDGPKFRLSHTKMDAFLPLHNGQPTRVLTLLIVALAILAIAAVFIAPGVTLQPTAMRAWRAAQNLLGSFRWLASIATSCLAAKAIFCAPGDTALEFPPLLSPPRVELTCVWLC
jgi:hypothetical protein